MKMKPCPYCGQERKPLIEFTEKQLVQLLFKIAHTPVAWKKICPAGKGITNESISQFAILPIFDRWANLLHYQAHLTDSYHKTREEAAEANLSWFKEVEDEI